MELATADLYVIALFFLSLIVIGIWSYFKNKNLADYFVAGGNLPWWLSGISHHVSGYSGAVFVAYAALAYTHGFPIYVWWAFTIGITVIISAKLFPVLWVRLRRRYQIQSPLEFLANRYNLVTQQLIAWSGVVLKLFDVGAKWAAIAVLLNVFTGLSVATGVLIAGGISLIYVTFGGLWGVIITDFTQFIVQVLAGITMLVVVLDRLGGAGSLFTFWEQLPEGNSQLFNDPYTVGFALGFLLINFFSYNGGNWNLATRYISSPNEKQATKAAWLSGGLYLIWPLILFLPMWAAPIILPEIEDPSQSYGMLTLELLPAGLTGLVVASLFASTLSMTSSDVNTIAAVITRDILPAVSKKFQKENISLAIARITTFVFTFLTIIIALQKDQFGGVVGLIISWFGALIGPIAVPMLFGLLKPFKSCGPEAAISAMAGGVVMFIVAKNINVDSLAFEVGSPIVVAAILYMGIGLIKWNKPVSQKVNDLLESIDGKSKE